MTTQVMTPAETEQQADRPAVHLVLYTITGMVLAMGIAHAILSAVYGWPDQLANAHHLCTLMLALWAGRAEFIHRRRRVKSTLSEIEQLEQWASYRGTAG